MTATPAKELKVKTIRYISFGGNMESYCGLTTESASAVLRRYGTDNVRDVRPATQAEIDWVRAMGGEVPEGVVSPRCTQKD